MKTIPLPRCTRASTMTDVLITVATVVLLAGVLLPRQTRCRALAQRIQCVGNLKQVGLALRIWTNDHDDKFPWEVSTNEGGTLELIHSTNVFLHFQAASNELSTPKILACNSDVDRTRVADFAQLDNRHLSYFVGLDARETDPAGILSGDRNLTTNGVTLGSGVFNLSAKQQMGWTKAIHKKAGNIGLSDGSVQQDDNRVLQKQWLTWTNATRRLAIP